MEVDIQHYDDIIIGGGKAGKTLAPALVADERKTALVERSLNMIGGGCINIACIPTKTMVASANVANTVRNSAAYGVKANTPIVDLAEVIQRKRSVVQSALEAGEVISTVQMVMQAQMPYTVLRDGILTHPTMTEGLNILFSKL
ncbi:FAD-dependent oxidoreductase [Nostoc sp. 106C]|uniref:FAD-dependent oxidoreductase n=1 Tax=Nostoc sp. 106C TaxID=1932667 RepID=UPI000B6BC13A|nr:FAD-dependent oxidoreductase [Nostoc sp. 106C]OUL36049.1 hypothetical protein BV375_00840 [Nostoc sp. 106C]